MGKRGARRLAWLLRTNRVLGADPEFRSAHRFADAFRVDQAKALAPSQISRWENARTVVDETSVTRYETLLQLPRHHLTAVHEASSRFFGGTPARRSPSPDGPQVLHALLDRACGAAMTGPDWRRLTRMVGSRPGLVLHPPGLWETIAHQLLTELALAEGDAWLVRQEAMSVLLEHPVATDSATAVCIAMADARDSPVVIDPISLLDNSRSASAARYVLDQVLAPRSWPAWEGALLAAAAKVRRGHFTPAQLADLAAATSDPAAASAHPTIAPLVEDVRSVLAHDVRRPAAPEEAAVCRRLGLAAQAGAAADMHEEDTFFAELIRESLFDRNSDHRLYAGFLIAATPYRRPLAKAVADELSCSRGTARELFVERGLRLVSRLRAPQHRVFVRSLLLDASLSSRARHAAAWASVHSTGRLDEPTWRSIVDCQLNLCTARPSPLDDDIVRGLVYSIGTDSHHSLLRRLSTDARLDTSARRLARWWDEHPHPLTDAPAP